MSLFGYDVPSGKNQVAIGRRRKIFEIIAPYVMSQNDIDVVREKPLLLRDIWLESMANSARTMLNSKLQARTKDFLRKFFPSDSLPSKKYAALIGMSPGTSILDRWFSAL